MSLEFECGQYELAYNSRRLQNYEAGNRQVRKTQQKTGKTEIVADSQGHLLPSVSRSNQSPWGNFVGTWDKPTVRPEPKPLHHSNYQVSRKPKQDGKQKHDPDENELIPAALSDDQLMTLSAEDRQKFTAAKCSLQGLHVADITELKSLNSPPVGVKRMMDALLIIFESPKLTWEAAKKCLADSRLIMRLKDASQKEHSRKVICQLRNVLSEPVTELKNLKKVSAAAYGLGKWIHAVLYYYSTIESLTWGPTEPTDTAHLRVQETTTELNQEAMQSTEDDGIVKNSQPLLTESLMASLPPQAKQELAATKDALETSRQGLKHSVAELKSLSKPPQAIKDMMDAVLILTGSPKVDWRAAIKLLGNNEFMKFLIKAEQLAQPGKVISQLKTILSDPRLSPMSMKKISLASYCLSKWLHAILQYYEVVESIKKTSGTF